MGDLPAIEWGAITHSPPPEAQANEQRATSVCYPSAAPAPPTARLRTVGEAAPVIGEISGDAGFRRPAVRERHGLTARSNRWSVGAPSRRGAIRDGDDA